MTPTNDFIKAALVALILGVLAFAGSGCIAVGGSDSYSYPTVGKQLQDLRVARDTGAISPAEYDQARSDILAGNLPHRGSRH